MIHIGKCIRKKIEEQGKTTVWFAQELGCHRTNIYKIYDKVTIDTGILLHISVNLYTCNHTGYTLVIIPPLLFNIFAVAFCIFGK